MFVQANISELILVVKNASTNEGVEAVTVYKKDGTFLGMTGEDGLLSLSEGASFSSLVLKHIAYLTAVVTIPEDSQTIIFWLRPTTLVGESVLIYARKSGVEQSFSYGASEEVIAEAKGVEMNKRAAFGWEPVIRGQSDGRVQINLNGMRATSACVDKMDPATSYIEIENLKSVDVSQSGFDLSNGAVIGGSVTLNAFEADPGSAGKRTDVLMRNDFFSPSRLLRASLSDHAGKISYRISASGRTAGDFQAGGGQVIEGSGYRKLNTKIDLGTNLENELIIKAGWMGDWSFDVGYPVLLMDTEKTMAHFGYVELSQLKRSDLEWKSRMYGNEIRHWMTDIHRDVASREVMPGMYMPMFGRSFTVGINNEVLVRRHHKKVQLDLDVWRVSTDAVMEMQPLDHNISPMNITNLGDLADHRALATLHWQLSHRTRVIDAQVGLEGLYREQNNTASAQIFHSIYGDKVHSLSFLLPLASISVKQQIRENLFYVQLARQGRMPTHIESFGYYLYNYVDGHFYTGNPNLGPEISNQMELGWSYSNTIFNLTASAWAASIQNVILGTEDDSFDVSEGMNFRRYNKVGNATILGFEAESEIRFSSNFSMNSKVQFTESQLQRSGEPLPLNPPLSFQNKFNYKTKVFKGSLVIRGAAQRRRISRKYSIEDATDRWAVCDAVFSRDVGNLNLNLVVNNIFDRNYTEHLSFGNLPSRGRIVSISIGWSIQ